uniref:Uncharacterized protein n=1 Tax=Anguilla anguilla TaxID=7936 RepID=A0A0E9W230_ANGAN
MFCVIRMCFGFVLNNASSTNFPKMGHYYYYYYFCV